MSNKKSESVRVVVRCRPLSNKEQASGFSKVVNMDVDNGVVMLHNPKAPPTDPPREFTFDSVYNWNSKQIDLYDETVRTIVDAVLEGYNGTVFAYGQTGTGKTYTMEGECNDKDQRGIIPNSFEHIFKHISQSENQQYLVRASYLEIYQEEIRDLLSKDHKQRLELKERPDTGVYVKDLSSFIAKSVKEIEHVMTIGNQNRVVGCTDMNEHSSRSHAIFVVTVESCYQRSDGQDHIRVGKLNLVDLAGSERQAKTGSSGEQFKQAVKINLSLSALGNVISALVDSKSTHIPYRDSKLTRLLQDSLGGNAKTIMIANIGPASYNYEETLTTLRYANRAKNIKNKPRINEDPKDALLREYQEEITRLKEALEKRRKKGHSKKKKRVNEVGEEVSEEEESDEDEQETSDKLKDMQTQLEQEKQSILQNTGILEEEKEKLVNAVERRVSQIKKEQKKRDQLATKIKAMESKLLSGGNIIDKTTEQQKALELQRQAIIDQKRKERKIQQQLELREEEKLEVQENYQTLHDETSSKERKLKKLQNKLKIVNSEIVEYREEQLRMREELMSQKEELEKQFKLRQLIIESFIPQHEVDRLKRRAVYNTEDGDWILGTIDHKKYPIIPRPVCDDKGIRPITMLAKQLATVGDVRYMADNILKLDLDMPTRTTHEYEGPVVSASVQAVLDKAVQSEEHVTIDASLFSKKTRHKSTKERQFKKPIIQLDPKEHYPIKRGLVKQ